MRSRTQNTMTPAISMLQHYPGARRNQSTSDGELVRQRDGSDEDAGLRGRRRREPPGVQPGALADQLAGRDVPQLDPALVERVVAPRGGPREVERGRAEAADVAHARQQAGDVRRLRGAHVRVVAEAGRDERGREPAAALGAPQRLAVEGRRLVAQRPPRPRRASGRRRGRRASPTRPRPRSRRTTAGSRRGSWSCRRAGRRSSAARSCRACPSPPRRACRRRAARPAAPRGSAARRRRRRRRRGRSGCSWSGCRPPRRRTPRAAGRRPRARSARRGRAARSCRRRSGIRSAHGRSCSICAASESSVASSSRAADELDGEREAVGREADRHRGGGLAGVVERGAVRHPARVAVEGPERAAALVGADRDRAAREHRREQDVGLLEQAADALRGGGPVATRPLERPAARSRRRGA